MVHKLLIMVLGVIVLGCSEKTPLISVSLNEFEAIEIDYTEDFAFDGITLGADIIISWARRNNYFSVYDEQLNLLNTVGRYGSGPGEFQKIEDIHITSNHIVVYDSQKKTLEYFKFDGTFNKSITLDRMITNLHVLNDTTIIINEFEPNSTSVLKLSGLEFENFDYLHTQSTRELLEGYSILDYYDDKVYVYRVLSNKHLVIDPLSKRSITFVNPYLPTRPEVVYQGEFKLPLGPVWRTGLQLGDIFLQVRNNVGHGSEIFRIDDKGSVNLKFELDFPISRMMARDNKVWIFTSRKLLKFPVHIFSQDYHDYS